jgi:oligopeptide/dipeptide ABC transporter ATP-binding protein
MTISGLRVDLGRSGPPVHVLRGVDLELPDGQVSGLVGESGSGKSTTMLAAAGLLPPDARTLAGSVRLGEQELVGLSERRWRDIRGAQIGVVFQNARAALHPLRTVGDQLARVHRRHFQSNRTAARRSALEVLAASGFDRPHEVVDRYPHQLSGGQCQRVMIGQALIAEPEVVLADEPTSGLDVTVQEQVLEMLLKRVRELRTGLLLISHDITVIERACDRVNVMYAGEVVESGSRAAVLEHPAHPYTQALLAAVHPESGRMPIVPGVVPDLRNEVQGCAFADRCPSVSETSRRSRPEEVVGPAGQLVRCVLYAGTPVTVSARGAA